MSSSSIRGRKSLVRAHLVDDLMIEILARLPTKSLRRFECVSKAWRGFISEVSSRRRVLRPMSGLFFYTWSRPRYKYGNYISVPEHHNEKDYCRELESSLRSLRLFTPSVMHVCNGLLLLYDSGTTDIIVWNPATMESVVLPDQRSSVFLPQRTFLTFDPAVSPHYKVLRFMQNSENHLNVQIYSSMSGNWVEFSFPHLLNLLLPISWDQKAVFLKGALRIISRQNFLVTFNVEEENFHQVLSLPENRQGVYDACIGHSRGHLYYALNMVNQSELKIWALDEGNANNWLLKHTILLTGDFSGSHTNPIAFNPDSELIYLTIPSKIFSCHASSGRMEEICNTHFIVDCGRVFIVIPCLESLDPPGGKFIRC